MHPSNCYQQQMIPSTHQQHFVNQGNVPPQQYGPIPPPPPPRDTETISASIDASSGSAGQSWGGNYGYN